MVTACPECNSGYTYERANDWRCRRCGETFDEPRTRTARPANTSPTLHILSRADPEDVPLT